MILGDFADQYKAAKFYTAKNSLLFTFGSPASTAICIQAQTANIFSRLFTFETARLLLET